MLALLKIALFDVVPQERFVLARNRAGMRYGRFAEARSDVLVSGSLCIVPINAGAL